MRLQNDQVDVPGILEANGAKLASPRCRCRHMQAFAPPRPRVQDPDRTGLELLVRFRAGRIQTRWTTKHRQISDGAHRVHTISAKRRMEFVKTVCVPRPQLVHYAATRFACFLLSSVSLHFVPRRRTLSLSDARSSKSMSILSDDRDRVHLEFDACRLFGGVLPRNNSCCFANYVQCCRNIFSVIAKD